MSSAEEQLLIDQIHKQFHNAIAFNLYTGLAYGMFLALYCISIRILLSKGSLFRSPGHMFMFGSSTLIFILATSVIIVGPGLTSQGIPSIIKFIDHSFAIGWSPHKIDVMTGVLATVTRLNPILSDVVCAWRAIVLWKFDRRVVTLLSACVLGTFAAGIYDLTLALGVHPGSQGRQHLEEGKVAVIIVGPMLGTNILSTSLIAWKAWEYRLTVGAHLRKGSPPERVQKVLALLIESGFAYCLLWVFYLLTAFGILPGAGTYIINLVMLYLSSMYPAIIIIIVCMQIGQEAYTTKLEPSNVDLTTVRFPAGESTVNDGQSHDELGWREDIDETTFSRKVTS